MSTNDFKNDRKVWKLNVLSLPLSLSLSLMVTFRYRSLWMNLYSPSRLFTPLTVHQQNAHHSCYHCGITFAFAFRCVWTSPYINVLFHSIDFGSSISRRRRRNVQLWRDIKSLQSRNLITLSAWVGFRKRRSGVILLIVEPDWLWAGMRVPHIN